MKIFIAGILCGVGLASVPFYLLLRSEQHNKKQFGVTQGFSNGLQEAASMLEKEFGTHDSKGEYKRIFSISTSDVIAVEVNGVKTVRVIP